MKFLLHWGAGAQVEIYNNLVLEMVIPNQPRATLGAPHARINLTTNTFKRHGPMAAEPHTLKLAPYIKREDPHLTMVDSLM